MIGVRLLAVTAMMLVPVVAAAQTKSSWPEKFVAPEGMEDAPGPWSDPADLTIWPNQTSRANGDAWLAANHDKITRMNPRVLLINFSNEHRGEHLERLTRQLTECLAESTRFHGYADDKAPPFLNYQVFKLVDLRDDDRAIGNSRKIPVKDPLAKRGFNMKYAAYFSDEFAAHYGVADPRNPKRMLRLNELLDGGYVHEVWFFDSGNVKSEPHVGAYEVVELKPQYDDAFNQVPDKFVQAGNGGDPDQPWTGRSCRIGCINASRGVGCFLESLAHGMEGTSNSGAIPYYKRYFAEFGGLDLNTRYKLPFRDLYGVDYGRTSISYPNPTTMEVTHGGKRHMVKKYQAAGGNAHFPPNARRHYDLDNDQPVMSTIEDWRLGTGPDGADVAKPWTNEAFKKYRDLAPDCMGAWLVYWRQNMPGYASKQKDDEGEPMKNWWPFLFY